MADVRSIEQDRVAFALEHIAKVRDADAYKRESSGFGPLVISNGLAGAVAFAAGKWKSGFIEHLDAWIASRREFERLEGRTVLAKIARKECDAATYRAISSECLAYSSWLKRLARAGKRNNGTRD